jgi:hypothetical protein
MSQYPQYSNYPPQPPMQQTSPLAIISLIGGILSWVGFFGIGAIVAIITGHIAVSDIKKNNSQLTGSGMAKIGLILGYLNIGFFLLIICLIFVLPLVGITLVTLPSLPFFNQ